MIRWIKKHSYWALAGGVLLVAIVAIGAYILHFWGLPPSDDPGHWADFATYLSGTVGVAAVVATLVAFVITLRQQKSLIESQERMIEKQEKQLLQAREQIELEREKENNLNAANEELKKYTAIYLLHQFQVLKDYYKAAGHAVINKNAEWWLSLAQDSPATYPKFFIEELGETLGFMQKLDGRMALDFAASVSLSKQLNHIIKFPFDSSRLSSYDVESLSEKLESMDPDVYNKALFLVRRGPVHCDSFIQQAEKITKKHVSQIDA